MEYLSDNEYKVKQLKKQLELLDETPETQLEKDINNLKYMMYGIQRYSIYYRSGMIKSLKNAIKLLEKKKNNLD